MFLRVMSNGTKTIMKRHVFKNKPPKGLWHCASQNISGNNSVQNELPVLYSCFHRCFDYSKVSKVSS